MKGKRKVQHLSITPEDSAKVIKYLRFSTKRMMEIIESYSALHEDSNTPKSLCRAERRKYLKEFNKLWHFRQQCQNAMDTTYVLKGWHYGRQ